MNADEALIESIEPHDLDGALRALQAGANPNAPIDGNWTCLSEAAARGHLDLVQALLQHGGTVAATMDDDGTTALHQAAENGALGIVQLLIEMGDGRDWLNRFDYLGRTPLACAAYADHAEVVEYLIAVGSDVNANDEERAGETALARAIEERASIRVIEALMKAGADPQIRGWMGISALDRAREQASQHDATEREAQVLSMLDRRPS